MDLPECSCDSFERYPNSVDPCNRHPTPDERKLIKSWKNLGDLEGKDKERGERFQTNFLIEFMNRLVYLTSGSSPLREYSDLYGKKSKLCELYWKYFNKIGSGLVNATVKTFCKEAIKKIDHSDAYRTKYKSLTETNFWKDVKDKIEEDDKKKKVQPTAKKEVSKEQSITRKSPREQSTIILGSDDEEGNPNPKRSKLDKDDQSDDENEEEKKKIEEEWKKIEEEKKKIEEEWRKIEEEKKKEIKKTLEKSITENPLNDLKSATDFIKNVIKYTWDQLPIEFRTNSSDKEVKFQKELQKTLEMFQEKREKHKLKLSFYRELGTHKVDGSEMKVADFVIRLSDTNDTHIIVECKRVSNMSFESKMKKKSYYDQVKAMIRNLSRHHTCINGFLINFPTDADENPTIYVYDGVKRTVELL